MNSEMDDNVAYVPAGFHSPRLSLLPPLCFASHPCLSLFVDGGCACQPVSRGESLHPIESGTGAQLQRLTSSLSERRFSPPAICTLSLSLSRSPSLSHPNLATHSLCTVVYSSYLSLPCSCLFLFFLSLLLFSLSFGSTYCYYFSKPPHVRDVGTKTVALYTVTSAKQGLHYFISSLDLYCILPLIIKHVNLSCQRKLIH